MSAVVQLTKIFSTSVMHGFQIRGYREQNAYVILQQEEEDAGTSVMTCAFKMLWRSIPPGRNYEGMSVQLKTSWFLIIHAELCVGGHFKHEVPGFLQDMSKDVL